MTADIFPVPRGKQPQHNSYHATTNDRFEVIYCPDKEKGIWFLPQGGVGPLQARAIEILKEIVDSH